MFSIGFAGEESNCFLQFNRTHEIEFGDFMFILFFVKTAWCICLFFEPYILLWTFISFILLKTYANWTYSWRRTKQAVIAICWNAKVILSHIKVLSDFSSDLSPNIYICGINNRKKFSFYTVNYLLNSCRFFFMCGWNETLCIKMALFLVERKFPLFKWKKNNFCLSFLLSFLRLL